MFALFNRFAWILSLIGGFLILFLIGIGLGEMNGNYGSFLDNDFFFIWIFLIGIFGALFKKIFLPQSFIEKRITFFAESLVKISSPSQPFAPMEEGVKKEDFSMKPLLQKPDDSKIETIETKVEKKKEPNFIQRFFAENLIAKLGGILIFLAVLFFLNLIYVAIGPVGKIIIGFLVGFTTFGIGSFLDKKGLTSESRVLLGIAILINYLVILSGRYLIGDNIGGMYLSIGTTFLFLIFNTILGVITSLLYKSKTLLLFSFLFAYLNPFLIGGSEINPYTYIGYSLIISIGALSISGLQKISSLVFTAFIGGNILILLAPFSGEIGYIIKILSFVFLSLLSIYVYYKHFFDSTLSKSGDRIFTLFGLSYVFLIIFLISGGSVLGLSGAFIVSLLSMLTFIIGATFFFMITSVQTVLYTLLFPIILLLGLLFTGSLLYIPFVLACTLIIYMGVFLTLGNKVGSSIQYVLFGILALFLFFINLYIGGITRGIIESSSLSHIEFFTLISSSFLFLLSTYYFSSKEKLENLYSIGTLGTIFSFLPIIVYQSAGFTFQLSIISISIFGLLNILLPFINKNLISQKNGISNLVIGLVLGGLFLIFQIYMYGNIYFPGIMLGYAFFGLAIIYLLVGIIQFNKNKNLPDISNNTSFSPNLILSYLGISISLITLAIAFVFSKHAEIIALAWILESTILMYFYSQSKEFKIYIASLILYFIGLTKLALLIDVVNTGENIMFVSLGIIALGVVTSLKFLNFEKITGKRSIHDIFHIGAIGIIGILMLEIIPQTGHGWSLFGLSIGILALSFLYSIYRSKILQVFFVILLGGFTFIHIGESEYIYKNVVSDRLFHLKALQYIAAICIGLATYTWNNNLETSYKKVVNSIGGIYGFIITTLFVHNFIPSTFAITIYWGILAFVILYYGISQNFIRYRTIGLYILFLTLGKVLLYDVWIGLDNAIMRVAALMGIGIMMMIISSLYSKKYGNQLKGEFSLSNLTAPSVSEKKVNSPRSISPKGREVEKKKNFNETIIDVDTDGIFAIKFEVAGGEIFTTRAKNLIKIVKFILDNANKTTFTAGELKPAYKYIVQNYKSDLSARDLETVKKSIKKFVDKGGNVVVSKR